MKHFVSLFACLCIFTCGFSQQVSENLLAGSWTTCGYFDDLDRISHLVLEKGPTANCRDFKCAQTTWVFSRVDGERTMELNLDYGCEGEGFQAGEYGEFGSWNYNAESHILTIKNFFDDTSYHFQVSAISTSSIELRKVKACN